MNDPSHIGPLMPQPDSQTAATATRRKLVTLGLLFGTIYFVQGIAEPTEGLIAQPVRSLLENAGQSYAQITRFGFLLAIPWTLKPLYGLLSDFVPLAGCHRKSYLILTSGATILGLVAAAIVLTRAAAVTPWLLWILLVPTLAVAFSDVVADALMVEHGQPLGITGRLQAVQWGAMYGATILAGGLGGYLSQYRLQPLALLICAGLTVITFVLSLTVVREPVRIERADDLRTTGRILWQAVKSPRLLAVCGYLFLWNFNPFSTTILYIYTTRELGFTQSFSGSLASLMAGASVAACAAYGYYSRRVSRRVLLHASIVMGIINTAAYWGLESAYVALPVTIAVGFVYMTATLIQLDIAAQTCPPRVAGTVFALLMAISNLALNISMDLGGQWYDDWAARWDSRTAFNLLVAVGAAFTACCWLLVPWLADDRGAGLRPADE